jgi:hypothetical protein
VLLSIDTQRPSKKAISKIDTTMFAPSRYSFLLDKMVAPPVVHGGTQSFQ